MAQSLRSASRRKYDSVCSSPAYTIPSAKAIRLVYCDENGVFRMDAEAVSALQLVKGPLGVVSVCGRARQGKSFILNQLLGGSSGFQVASTHRPCTKGLWMWSTPIKRTSPDGTEYSLLLLDTEGIDAYDQTGTYSTQIFSLAVLLSSMFIYNQMGGIDEASLDRLSLVTEMTKHIRVKASDHRPSISELGQFTPVFLWLLRDFYLDLIEEDKRISPKDYLEAALQPVSGHGSSVAAKNKIRDSILGLFPDRDCFTLVRPLNSERELQRLDQIPMEKLRPEFRAGLDALTKLIFERAKPKQLGSVVMTGPLLVGLTQSFLDAINAGAVPTIATSWQNVEESECRRAHDVAMEVYLSAFKDSALDNEEVFRTTHESSIQDALHTYNSEAVGFGAPRQKYEKLLVAAFKRYFEENLHKIIMEAEVKCAKALEKMDEKLWGICQSSDVSISEVFQVLGDLVTEYEETTHGPTKLKKFVKFLRHSLEGPLLGIAKRYTNQTIAESTGHQMKIRSLEDRLTTAEKQFESAKRDALEWKKRYESVFDENKSSDIAFSSQYMALQKCYNSLEENYNHVLHQLETVRKEASDWRTQYEGAISERNAGEEQLTVEIRALQSRCSAAEGRLAAAREQLESLKEEAEEWRRKYEAATEEADSTSESAKAMCDRLSKQYQAREDALREELQSTISEKEKEAKDVQLKLEQSQRHMSSLQSQLEDYKSKYNLQEDELSRLRSELRSAKSSMDKLKSNALSLEKEVEILKKENSHLEGKLSSESKKVEELHEKCNSAEHNVKVANERANKAWEEAKIARKQKLELDRIAAERLAAHENAERRCESLAREKEDLLKEVEMLQVAELDTVSKVRSLDKHLEERDKEMEGLLDSAHKQRANSIHVLESLLDSERQACAEANARAEALSVKLQTIQSKLDALQQEFSTSRLSESLLDGKLRIRHGVQTSLTTPSPAKRLREEDNGADESIHDINVEATNQTLRKKPYNLILDNGSSPTQSQCDTPGILDNTTPTSEVEDPDSHANLNISRLRHELTSSGFGEELQQLRNPTKKEVITLYEKRILQKKVRAS